MEKKEIRTRIEQLIQSKLDVDDQLKQLMQQYSGDATDSIPYKKMIREEFNLVI